MRNSFRKSERIVSQKTVEELFGGGKSHSMSAFPLRLVYMVKPRQAGSAAMILVSVPKKRLKLAVDRNRVKRQVREAYRLAKHLLDDSVADNQQVLMAFVWTANETMPSQTVRERTEKLLNRMKEQLQKK